MFLGSFLRTDKRYVYQDHFLVRGRDGSIAVKEIERVNNLLFRKKMMGACLMSVGKAGTEDIEALVKMLFDRRQWQS